MGRGRGKGKKQNAVTSHEDQESGGEESLPAHRRRGRPQKPLKEEPDDEGVEKAEEKEEDAKPNASTKEIKGSTIAENGRKRKRNTQNKENNVSIQDENTNGTRSSTEESIKINGFRQNGSRRKSKPRRAAEVGVECK